MNSIATPSPTRSAPFPAACALDLHHFGDGDNNISYLPDEPSVSLEPEDVHSFLCKELSTPTLDELYDKLWTVAKRSGQHIDPLHRHKVKSRTIVPTEDPKLHLIWKPGTIYMKPIPLCLLNHDVWKTYLCSPGNGKLAMKPDGNLKSRSPGFDASVALGFLRSYAFLVQHRLDFVLAQELHLIPPDINWIQWSKFMMNFRQFDDSQVAKRYHYGQLRASRLNWAVRVFRPQSADTMWFYEIPHWSTITFLEHAVVPFVYVFASLSVILSSLQVVLSVPADVLSSLPSGSSGYAAVGQTAWVFSIMILLFSAAFWFLVFAIPSAVLAWQFSWGFRHRQRVTTGFDGS